MTSPDEPFSDDHATPPNEYIHWMMYVPNFICEFPNSLVQI